jgi:hypothetical protein
MGFLTPAFLAGLAALAVPILIHLTHRPRTETVPFPSLMFLQRIAYRSTRRQSLRHWLLFALRAAAFALLAFAFARPFFGTERPAAAVASGATTRIVLLDRSGSMGYPGRWPKAVGAARRALEELGPQDRASLVLFDAVPASTGEPTGDRSRLLSALASSRAGFAGTRYAPALRMAAEMLEASTSPRREVVLVTDFQKTGWDAASDARLPADTALRWVDVSEGGAANLALTGVELRRDYEAGKERVIASARVVNRSAAPENDLELVLEVDGRVVRQARTSLGPNTSGTVTFEAFPLPEAAARSVVRVAPRGLPADDAFHFALVPGGDVPVLVLEGAGASARRSLYLRRALAVGQSPRFRVDVKPAGQAGLGDFAASPVIVSNDAPPPGGGVGQRLRETVEKGAGLLIVMGEESAARAWAAAAPSLLPGGFGPTTDRSADRGGTLAYLDYDHPVFELFRGPRGGDFSAARFLRYHRLDAKDGVLARYDDGAVALAERAVGRGRVLVWTSSLDTAWNDLALQPVFLPFLHQLVKYAGRHVTARPSYTVGDVLDLSAEAELEGKPAAVTRPGGETERLAAGAPTLELAEPGFYEVRRTDGGSWSRLVAVNLDPAESDLVAIDPEELATAVRPADGVRAAAHGEPAPTREEHEDRQAFWRYLLFTALGLLAAETLLSNRPASARRVAVGARP